MTRITRVTTDDDDAGMPRPLVMGSYVYHWMLWRGVMMDVVQSPRLAQFVVQREDGGDLIIKDAEYEYPASDEIQAGHDVVVVGLGDRTLGNTYYFCGLVDVTSTSWRHLSGWLGHIEWSTAHKYFGWRTRREAKDSVQAYYTAVLEVLCRICHGPLGTSFEKQVVPIAQKQIKKWKFGFLF